MSSTDETPPGNGTASHVDRAVIDVSHAEIIQSPQSARQARYLAYALVVLFVLTTGIGAANLLFTSSNVHKVSVNSAAIQHQVQVNQAIIAVLQQQLRADCSFYADLAGLPLVNAANGKPSVLSVKVISDSRGAWHGHSCPGKLAAPSPSFVAGAALYHLPVN